MLVNTDHNFLICLEKGESVSAAELKILHDESKINIVIPGIGASEMLKEGRYAINFNEFDKRLKTLFTNREPIVKYPPGFWTAKSEKGDLMGGNILG